jgi:signal transduction histidine kinase
MGLILFLAIRKSLARVVDYPGGTTVWPMKFGPLLALILAAVAVGAMALRRRRPVFMLGLLLVASVVLAALTGGDASAAALTYFLPVAFVLYLVAANFETRQTAVRVLAAVFVTLTLDVLLLGTGAGRDPVNAGAIIPVILSVGIAWSTGYIVRQRRRYSIGLQVEAASKAVAEERLRIARELHDVVAHSMSVIAVQAGYGQYVIDTQPADARAALGAIQATSREALDEMRRMLGALRQADEAAATTTSPSPPRPGTPAPVSHQDGVNAGDYAEELASYDGAAPVGNGLRPADALAVLTSMFRMTGSLPAAPSGADAAAAPLFPAPGLDDLDRLLARTGSAGVQVSLRRRGEPRPLPPSIDLSAYRIIQEALTNVVKHAHASRCEVQISYGAGELVIRVTDSGAGLPVPASVSASVSVSAFARAGSGAVASARGALGAAGTPGTPGTPGTMGTPVPGGHGIIGMRERVSLLGGEFSAGPLPGYGFEVLARIPMPTDSRAFPDGDRG